jgi:UDP-glucose 4-epimerase
VSKVLVTGGCGFIGSYVVEKLLEKNNEVIVVDYSVNKIRHHNNHVAYYPCDVLSEDLEEVMKRGKPDYVIHLAESISTDKNHRQLDEECNRNIKGSVHVVEMSHKYGVKKFLYASSGMVYGNSYGGRAIPTYYPVQTKHPMGIGKATVELYLQFVKEKFGLDYTILRLSEVYGPRSKGGIVETTIEKLFRGEEQVFHEEERYDLIYVEDAAEAIVAALQHDIPKVLHVSTGQATSYEELIHSLSELSGMKIISVFGHTNQELIHHHILDNEETKTYLKWFPKTTLQDGLRKMLTERTII